VLAAEKSSDFLNDLKRRAVPECRKKRSRVARVAQHEIELQNQASQNAGELVQFRFALTKALYESSNRR
jgi:hypothetical protein